MTEEGGKNFICTHDDADFTFVVTVGRIYECVPTQILFAIISKSGDKWFLKVEHEVENSSENGCL